MDAHNGGVGLKNEALEGMYHFDKEQDPHQSENRDPDPHKKRYATLRVTQFKRSTFLM